MPVRLSRFVQQARSAGLDHGFVVNLQGRLATRKLDSQTVNKSEPDRATKAFIAALHSKLKDRGKDAAAAKALNDASTQEAA